MSDYASIMGGNVSEGMIGRHVDLDEVGQDWDARYFIETDGVFLDRFDTSGNSIVEAATNPGAIGVALGSGTDTVNAGAGDDTVWTGAGDDFVNAGGGANTVSGAAGDDSIESGSGDDSLMGGAGDDGIYAGLGNDHASGGSGADTLFGGGGSDSLFGGTGNDALFGNAGNDSLFGGNGADLLVGGAGDDSLFGGSGGDVFSFDSGFGRDVISDFGAGDRINIAAGINNIQGIETADDLVRMQMVSGGTTAAGTKFTVITIGNDTIRLEKVDHNDFINQINTWVRVG